MAEPSRQNGPAEDGPRASETGDPVGTADGRPMLNGSRRLGEFLVQRKVLSREALEAALQREAAEKRPLASILVAEGMVGEKDLVAGLADQVGKRFVDLTQTVVPVELDGMVPAELASRHLALAVDVDGT